jgi:hypothetical protein
VAVHVLLTVPLGAGAQDFAFFCAAASTWSQSTSPLASHFHRVRASLGPCSGGPPLLTQRDAQILHSFKASVGSEQWAHFAATFPDHIRDSLRTKYQL